MSRHRLDPRTFRQDPGFRWYDSSLNAQGKNERHGRALFHRTMNRLAELGFTVGDDPRIVRDYKILAPHHRVGVHPSGLMFKSEVYPIGFKVEFYQELITVNKCGGAYDFDKVGKMPYLIRLHWQLVRAKLTAFLLGLGWKDETEPVPTTADEIIAKRRADWMKSHGPHFYDSISSYNAKDRDGGVLTDGCFRYFRDHDRRLGRGIVWHSANNMWMVRVNRTCVRYMAASELFQCEHPAQEPRRFVRPDIRKVRLENIKAKAVSSEDFERAAVLRDILKAEAAGGQG